MKQKPIARVTLRAGRPLVPVRPDHLAQIRAESRRRKAAKEPHKFMLDVTDEVLDRGLGAVVSIKQTQTQTKERN